MGYYRIVGVHTGAYNTEKINFGTAINAEKMEWIISKINDWQFNHRLFYEENKYLNGLNKYFKNITLDKKNNSTKENILINHRLFYEENKCVEYQSNESYVGYYKDHKKNGYGVKKYADGDEYHGQWKDGKMHGYGVYWIYH